MALSSASDIKNILKFIEENAVRWIDLRFTDSHGKEQHVTIPASKIDEDWFETGQSFDGSSIAGWKDINDSDMMLTPDATSFYLDPFTEEVTIALVCQVLEKDFTGYNKDPRTIAKKAETYLKETGIADVAFFGPEPEFFVFDEVRWSTDMSSTFYIIDSNEGTWNTGKKFQSEESRNLGHRPFLKGGYFPVPPVDQLHELRSDVCVTMETLGISIEAHHHEVSSGGQCEIAVAGNSLTKKADEVQTLKYITFNTTDLHNKTATFMPKPIVGDNGSGMHINQSLSKNGKNIFAGNGYAGLSQEALWYLGGILKHARALNAFTNSSTNSYKRLVPGFEAPTLLAYSANNRSAAIRLPFTTSDKTKRIELRFPDAISNPYLAFSACLMAGIDGIKNKIEPGEPNDKDLYSLSKEEEKEIPKVCESLLDALRALDADREFLLAGGVFSNEMLDSYIELKMKQVDRLRSTTHPVEFDMYYSA